MANTSIFAAFERMWQHILAKLGDKVDRTDLDALTEVVDGKADASHSHTITASASDDDVIVLTGTNGANKVTYSASHADSGVTTGTYKSVTVDVKGHVTGGTNPNTLAGFGITNAYTKDEIDSTVSDMNTSITNIIDGTTSVGEAIRAKTASSADMIGTNSVGSKYIPIYLDDGIPIKCAAYAGGTVVNLNGEDYMGQIAEFYAPTSAGTEGYILKSSGSGAPSWLSTLPIENGGTNATTIADARKNLDIYSTTEVNEALTQKTQVQIITWEDSD